MNKPTAPLPTEIEKWIEETWPIVEDDKYQSFSEDRREFAFHQEYKREGARAAILKLMPLVKAGKDLADKIDEYERINNLGESFGKKQFYRALASCGLTEEGEDG